MMAAFRNAELKDFMFPEPTITDRVHNGTPDGALPSHSNNKTPVTNQHASSGNPKILLDFMLQLYPFVDESLPTTPLMDKICHNLDHYLPFREHAPQRLRSTGLEGPYHPDVVDTRAGFFGALFWRGISYSTNSAHRDPMVFTLQDFIKHKKSLAKATSELEAEKHFCNTKAYGTYNCFRTTTSAERYWETSGRSNLTNWLNVDPKPSYLEQWEFFKGTFLRDNQGKYGKIYQKQEDESLPSVWEFSCPPHHRRLCLCWQSEDAYSGRNGRGYHKN